MITIWFHPLFEDLQEPMQSWIHHAFHHQHAGWPPEALDKIRSVIPDYRGTVEPPDSETGSRAKGVHIYA